jgi:hypothetical protein
MFRLLGGGVPGDLVGLPRSQLAVLPDTTHVTLITRTNWLLSMIPAFLDAPMPTPKNPRSPLTCRFLSLHLHHGPKGC